jgi:diguanylate cyclase (GGDEF)-like protein/PAS domain S-box-containing protein
MIDGAGQVALSNERFRTMYAIPEALLAPGAKFRDLVHYRADVGTLADDPEQFCDEITDKLSQGRPVKALTQLQNGRFFHVLRQPMEGGGWVSIHEDATEQHLSKEALEQTKRFLDTIIESVPIPIVVKDAKSHTFVLVNKAFEAFFGLPRDRLINRTVFEIYTADDAQRIAKWDQAAISSRESQVNADFNITTRGSGLRSVNTTRLVVPDAKGAAQYVIAVIEDITEKKRAHAEIAHMAHHDPLTDLPNRAMLSERLDQALANLYGDAKLGVLFLDLDHFKTVNDTLGHLVGDELLREVATRLSSCVRESDTVARLGGDEFAIIQVGVKEVTDTAELAERVRAALTAPYDLGGLRAVIDVSIGIAHAPTDGKVSDDLMKRADLALYKAKTDGRGRYRFFEPEMDARIKARRVVETDLRNALVDGEFQLWYQPVVKIATGQVEGLEALLRWKHRTRGVVSPAEFIAVAEETGLIIPLGEWVIRQACEEAARWPANVKVAVNLSPVQFSSPNLVNVVVHALAASGIPASRLELEITEAMLLSNSQSNLTALSQLRSLGVQIVMDDFGTGYSSLNYLRNFHFDKIKIDGAFVRDLSTGNELSLAIVQTVAHLAGVMNVPTTAEGVETDEQLALVTAAGCTHFQGNFFSPPRPANEIHGFLRPRRSKSFAA